MSYDLYIQRFQPGKRPVPITLKEWKAAVSQVNGVRLATGRQKGSRKLDGDTDVYFPERNVWFRVFQWIDDQIVFQATAALENAPISLAARTLASLLDARIVGEEDEELSLDYPSCPVVLSPGWLSSKVAVLAQAIHDERAFDRLIILADALEEAGCENADILNHCRSREPHVNGCWVVDLLLEKQ